MLKIKLLFSFSYDAEVGQIIVEVAVYLLLMPNRYLLVQNQQWNRQYSV